MKRAFLAGAVLAGAGALALGGCRAVLGIDDLQLADGGAEGGAEAGGTQGDAGGHDGGGPHDASAGGDTGGGGGPDAAPDGPADNCAAMAGLACVNCCQMTYGMDFGQLLTAATQSQCICGAAPCASECSTTVCAQPPGGMPNMQCSMCLGSQLTSGSVPCNNAISACLQSTSCAPAAQCVKRCP